MPFFSPMAARMPAGRVANEGVTTARKFLLRKEIVIHFGPTSTLEIKTKMVPGSWANSRAGAQ
jgi:hypothetical protein